MIGLVGGGKLLQRLADDAYGLAELSFGDDQGRSKSDDVSVSWFGLSLC